jgi:hypothetical protein
MTASLRQHLPHSQGDMFPDPQELGRAVDLLTQRYFWYYPTLNQLTGGHKSALMLGMLIHWSRHYHNTERHEREGWIWKTIEEWKRETGLSRHEQDAARARLLAMGLVEEQKRGMPARMYFKVRLDVLGRHLAALCGVHDFERWDWHNAQQLLRLLGRPVAYYLKVAQLTGGATSSLYLSFLLSAQRQAVTTAYTVDWIRPRADHISKLLGLSYKVQLLARKQLCQLGLVEARPSRNFGANPELRLRYGRVIDLLAGGLSTETGRKKQVIHNEEPVNKVANSLSSNDKTAVLEVSDPSIFPFSANRDFPFRQTEISLSGKQGMPKPANRDFPNWQTSLPKREISIYTTGDLPCRQTGASQFAGKGNGRTTARWGWEWGESGFWEDRSHLA